jgi:hypothetical protein
MERGDATPIIGSTKANLRHFLLYLRCIVTHAVRHHQAQTPEDSLTRATLHDYLTWLTVDALQDEALARHVTTTLARLQEELHVKANSRHIMDRDPTPQAYHEGFLHALEQTLSLSHGVDLLLHEEISRGDFLESWERTRERLGL